jgi:hypothetical protein
MLSIAAIDGAGNLKFVFLRIALTLFVRLAEGK